MTPFLTPAAGGLIVCGGGCKSTSCGARCASPTWRFSRYLLKESRGFPTVQRTSRSFLLGRIYQPPKELGRWIKIEVMVRRPSAFFLCPPALIGNPNCNGSRRPCVSVHKHW